MKGNIDFRGIWINNIEIQMFVRFVPDMLSILFARHLSKSKKKKAPFIVENYTASKT